LVAAYTFATAVHRAAVSSAAVGVPPEAVVSSTLLVPAMSATPRAASVWTAY
jgi:hypothetical protein